MTQTEERPIGAVADALPAWPDDGYTRLPHWLYRDAAVYRREVERIFDGPSWNYVALEAEVPAPGDHVLTTVGETPVIVVRDGTGDVNVLVNRCAHRGVMLCRTAGTEGAAKKFTCPYHQWTYRLDGSLVGVPFRKGVKGNGGMPADFDPSCHGLTRLRVARRNGVVFATHSAATPPFEASLGPEMLRWFDRVFDGRELRVLGYLRQRVPANWKLMMENIKDPYHASLLHVFLVTFGLFRADQRSEVRMDDTGAHAVLVSSRGAQVANDATNEMSSFRADLQLRDPALLDPVAEFPGDATVVMQTLWPNLIVQQQSNTLATRQLVVRGPGEFDLNWTFFGYADDDEAMVTRRLRQANLMGPSGLVSIDDSEVLALAQDGCDAGTGDDVSIVEMGGRGTEGVPHMVTEVALRAFYRHYREVMGL
jgi:salicylate 5-hydroxylase large subunit